MKEEIWIHVSRTGEVNCDRLKVDGGWLYRSGNSHFVSQCFVPDIDLARYQSHMRDAYNQGYKAGHEDCRLGVDIEFQQKRPGD